jgi:hypothetical protein
VLRVEREVSGARLEDAEDGRQHVEAARCEQRDD